MSPEEQDRLVENGVLTLTQIIKKKLKIRKRVFDKEGKLQVENQPLHS